MNRNDMPPRPNHWRVPMMAVAVMVALAVLVVGVRQVTVEVRGGDDRLSTAPAAGVADSGNLTGPAGEAPAGQDGSDPARDGAPQAEAGPLQGTMSVGPVVADEEFAFTPVPDQVTIKPGPAPAARVAPQYPDGGSDGGGSSAGGVDDQSQPGGPGPIYGDADDIAGGPLDGAPDDLTVAAQVETTGYQAEVRVGVGYGLGGGLAALSIDFGDGTERFVLDDDRITAIGSRGLVVVRHTYEPTLTLQPRTAVVTVTDGAGQTYERRLRFETRAAFRLNYSPLTVTALRRCDTVGKGDFTLTWQNDTSLPPGKTSKFKLGKNESHEERGFVTDIEPVYYNEFPELFLVDGESEFFYVRVEERDLWGLRSLAVWRWGLSFDGVREVSDFFTRGPVAQLGDHRYQVAMDLRGVESGGGDNCDVRAEFTATLVML